MWSTAGFVLSYIKYGDNDAVLHAFTKENGYESFFLKGIYSYRNPKKIFLQPLNELIFFCRQNDGTSLRQVTKIEPVKIPEDIGIRANAAIFFISEFLSQILKNEDKQPKIYAAIQKLVTEISHKNYSADLFFLMEILKISGLAPLLSHGEYLNPESGIFSNDPADKYFTKEISALWKKILDEEENQHITIEPTFRTGMLNSILKYYQWHYPNFRTPKSLDILRQIWD